MNSHSNVSQPMIDICIPSQSMLDVCPERYGPYAHKNVDEVLSSKKGGDTTVVLENSDVQDVQMKSKSQNIVFSMSKHQDTSYKMQNSVVPVVGMPRTGVQPGSSNVCYVVNGYMSRVSPASDVPSCTYDATLASKATYYGAPVEYNNVVEDDPFSLDCASFQEVMKSSPPPNASMSSQPIYQSSPLYAVDDCIYM